jgi:hypothetical protein
MLATNPLHHDISHFVAVPSVPTRRSCFGLPEDALIIPPMMYPRPRDSPGNTPVARQLPE